MPGYVYQLKKKLHCCIQVLCEAGELDSLQQTDFCKYIDIPGPTLKSAVQVGRVSKELETRICSKCRFDPHPYWIDPKKTDDERRLPKRDYNGRDTPAAFYGMLRQAWELPKDLGLALRSGQFKSADASFASFAIINSGQATANEETVVAFLEVDVGHFRHEHPDTGELFTYGFNQVILELDLGPNIKIVNRLGLSSISLGGAKLRARGSSLAPYWELSVPSGLLDGLYCSTDPLFEISEAEQDTTFEASLKACIMDGSLRGLDEQRPIGIEKQRVLELLMARGFGQHDNGRITLAVQQLTIVKRE